MAWCADYRPERSNSPVNPEQHHVAQRPPKALVVGAIEVGIYDILVFLRGVLSVLDRAVRPALEPFRMVREPRMIRRALDSEIQRDLHSVVGASRDQPAEIVERAELGVDRIVSA